MKSITYKNHKLRNTIISAGLIVLIISVTLILYNNYSIPSKDRKQVNFISNFLSSIGSTDALDSKYVVRNQLYDKNLISQLKDFEWYHFASVSLKKATAVKSDETDGIKETTNYLLKKYSVKNIEVYKVTIESTNDNDSPTYTKNESEDVFYLTKKDDGNYCLLCTEKLFPKLSLK